MTNYHLYRDHRGRPRHSLVSQLLRELREQQELEGKPMPAGRNLAKLLAERLWVRALRGEYRFVRELLDRTEGRPRQSVELSVSEPESPDDLAATIRALEPRTA